MIKAIYFIFLNICFFNVLLASECVAHRGYSSKYLENSLEAFVAAQAVNADVIEFDVHHTFDGVAIVMHDGTLERTTISDPRCPQTKEISQLFWHEIDRHCRLLNGENIPTLDQVLALMSNNSQKIFIELKDRPTLKDIELLENYYGTSPELIKIISFEDDYLKLVKKFKLDFEFLKSVELYKLQLIGTGDAGDYDGINSFTLSVRQMKSLQSQNKIAAVWTVDKESRIEKYFEQGYDYITTNKIELCQKISLTY